jgi:hypothetical protein
MASSPGATQPIQAPCSSHSTHNTTNVNSEHDDGAPTKKLMELCQEHSRSHSRSLFQQDLIKPYYISKHKEIEKIGQHFCMSQTWPLI